MGFGGTANLSIIITAIDKASGTFNKVGNNLSATGAKMKSVGKGMTMGLTLPIVAVGAASIKMGLDFGKGVEYANTMLKLGGEELTKFKNGVLDLSDKYGKSADDIARAAYSVSSVLHTTGEETVVILDAIAAGAKAGKITTEEAGNAVIRMMSIYDIKAEDTMKLVDTLSATVKAGNANWADMAEILPNVAGLAKPLGITLEEVAAAFAAVSAKAGSSAEAGTALRGVFTGLMKPSESMKDAIIEMGYANAQAALKAIGLKGVLEKLGAEYGDNAEAIGELFPNIRGITGAVALFANGGKDLAESMDMVYDSTGETQKQIEAGQGSAEKFADAMNKLKNAGIRLFEAMEPMLTKFVGILGDLASKLSGLSPATRKVIVIVGALLAALGPILMILGTILPALPLLAAAFSPVGLAIAAIIVVIGLLIKIGWMLYHDWDLIVEGYKIMIQEKFTAIKNFFVSIWEGIKSIFRAALDFIKYLFLNWTVPGLIIKHWDNIVAGLKAAKDAIINAFLDLINWFKELPGKIWDAIKGIPDKIKEAFKLPEINLPSISGIGEKVGGFFSGVGEKLKFWQEGGIVPGIGPQLAVVHGGETIIPKGKGLGGDINIYIQGGNYLDREAGEKFAEILGKMLRKELRYQKGY